MHYFGQIRVFPLGKVTGGHSPQSKSLEKAALSLTGHLA
jgi:hypothetical protein